jgi:ferrochelatase
MGMTNQQSIAVVLLQLGGPDTLDAVEPFLYNLFCDPDIINFPGAFLARKYIARRISSSRSKKVAERYRKIGGKSPIYDLTKAQALALERELRKTIAADVYIAMRYWHPLTDEVIKEIKQKEYKKIILLPLYPQYSLATTVSSIKEWNRQVSLLGFTTIPTETVCCYHNHHLYIDAIIENINIAAGRFSPADRSKIDLVFSAHGIPMSLVRKGDPYKGQIEETVRLVVQGGQWNFSHHLCYQSKVGPAEWLKPSLDETITTLAARSRHFLLVVPVAFVTEHIETLHEINIEARERAIHLGVKQFEMMPALNDHPKFIACLKEMVLNNI